MSQCTAVIAEQTSSHLCAAHAVARKANATIDEMQAVVSMQLLDVLLIVTHSQANRQRLLSLGLLTALADSMKVSPLRLHALTSIGVAALSAKPILLFLILPLTKHHSARAILHETIA